MSKRKITLVGYTCASRREIEQEFDAMICPPSAVTNNHCTADELRRCRKVTVIVKKGWKK